MGGYDRSSAVVHRKKSRKGTKLAKKKAEGNTPEPAAKNNGDSSNKSHLSAQDSRSGENNNPGLLENPRKDIEERKEDGESPEEIEPNKSTETNIRDELSSSSNSIMERGYAVLKSPAEADPNKEELQKLVQEEIWEANDAEEDVERLQSKYSNELRPDVPQEDSKDTQRKTDMEGVELSGVKSKEKSSSPKKPQEDDVSDYDDIEIPKPNEKVNYFFCGRKKNARPMIF